MGVPVRIDGWTTVEFIGTLAGQIIETVFVYKAEPPLTSETSALAFANSWRTTMATLLQNACTAGFQLERVRVKTHNATFPDVEAVSTFPAGTFGAIAGDASPGNVTIATKLLTGIVGRWARGRQYWPGVAEGGTLGNVATSTFINLLSQVFTRHLLGFTSDGIVYLPAVASRSRVVLRVLIGFAIEQYLDSQRRRLTGRGR